MLLVLLVFSAFQWVLSDVPACNGNPVVFNKPENVSQYTWYPSNFAGQQPPLFPNDYVCNYKINVPPNWSAMVVLSLNLTTPPMDQAVSVIVTDHNRRIETVQSTPEDYFYFISPGGQISLATRNANVRFGFAIKWTQNPQFIPYHDNVTVDATQPTLGAAYAAYPYQVKAQTRVSLVVIPPLDLSMKKLLRGVLVFDGPDWNSSCIGTALQLLEAKRQYVSTSQYMTVYQLQPSYFVGNALLVFQDYENTKDIVEYQGVACQKLDDCGQYTMSGRLGNAAITTVNQNQQVGAEDLISLSGDGNIDVYIGGKTKSKSNLITSYTIGLNDTKRRLPQEFLGYVTTYVLNGQSAVLNTTTDGKAFGNDVQVGRKGFIASCYYNIPMQNQDVLTIIRNTNTYVNWKFNIRDVDFVGNSTLTVSVYSTSKYGMTFQGIYNSTNRPDKNKQITAIGTFLSAEYLSYGQVSKGFIIDFEAQNSASKISVIVVSLMLMIFNLL